MTEPRQSHSTRLSIFQRIQLHEEPPSWSLAATLVFVGAYAILWVAGQAFIVTITGGQFDSPTPAAQILGAALGCFAVILGVLQWARRRQGTLWLESLQLHHTLTASIFIITVVGLASAGLVDLARIILKIDSAQAIPLILSPLAEPIGPIWLWAAFLAVVIQPIAEGLVFYGIFYPTVSRIIRDNAVAVILVAFVFTIITFLLSNTTEPRTWSVLVQPFVMALVLGGVRAYTKSTRMAIVARVMWGVFYVLSGLIAARG